MDNLPSFMASSKALVNLIGVGWLKGKNPFWILPIRKRHQLRTWSCSKQIFKCCNYYLLYSAIRIFVDFFFLFLFVCSMWVKDSVCVWEKPQRAENGKKEKKKKTKKLTQKILISGPKKGKRQDHLSPSSGTKRIIEISPMDETQPHRLLENEPKIRPRPFVSTKSKGNFREKEGVGNFWPWSIWSPHKLWMTLPNIEKRSFLFHSNISITNIQDYVSLFNIYGR